MISEEFIKRLSPEEKATLEALQAATSARGIQITVEGEELVFSRNGEEPERKPLSFLSAMSEAA